MVQRELAPFARDERETLRAQMTELEQTAADLGMKMEELPDTAPKKQEYLRLQKQLAEGTNLAGLETDVYSALYAFFSRYYEEGDFISKRRLKEGVYAIPYEGEEVKLYWANQDQYYIKTSENFKDYTFEFGGIAVHFRLMDATTERDNNKETGDGRRALVSWRTVTGDRLASNAALNAFFAESRPFAENRAYDAIYVNGDNQLEALRRSGERWTVEMTEFEFRKRMFEEE